MNERAFYIPFNTMLGTCIYVGTATSEGTKQRTTALSDIRY